MTTAPSPSSSQNHDAGHAHGGAPIKLAIAALGVVYGDIGTSPLYSLRECFIQPHGVQVNEANILGALSLFLWALTMVVVVKYLTFVMRADNEGEGGILALLALLKGPKANAPMSPRVKILALCGLFGAALLYGDGVITPAISVLSAVEGLGVATTAVDPYIVPITAGILVGLFMMQKRGTATVGRIFGPATLLWFATLVMLGLPWILRRPEVLRAVDPRWAIRFFVNNGKHGFLVLGAVVLCITGGEALYADMGHFGRKPIKLAWYTIVFPALIVSYLGQGALYLDRIAKGGPPVENPFFEQVSGVMLYPVVAIATVATVVASQALISGAYSLTRQAIQLGYWPRMTIVHTSGTAEGQIYMPDVNQALMIACLALVFGFRSSAALASAYGIAVTGTMAITTVLFYAVVRARNMMNPVVALGLTVVFMAIDLSFFAANATKIADGGWFPIAVAVCMFVLMTTWKRGREALGKFMAEATLPLDVFLADLKANPIHRITGTGVFMTSNPNGVPPVLLHHVKHNRVLHQNVVLLSVSTRTIPEVPANERVMVTELKEGFFQVKATYGFMESPNVPDILGRAGGPFPAGEHDVTYYLGRETLLTSGSSTLATWRKRIFSLMSRNAQPATAFFNIPPNRVVELGTQVQL